jgi:hypothetical protein
MVRWVCVRRFLGITFALLALAVAGLWLRSYFVADVISTRAGKGASGVWTFRGNVLYVQYWFGRTGLRESGWHYTAVPVADAAGFGAGNPFFNPLPVAPLWLVSGLCAGGATLLLWRRCVPPPGDCPACGYDCRATPYRCPECGKRLKREMTAFERRLKGLDPAGEERLPPATGPQERGGKTP